MVNEKKLPIIFHGDKVARHNMLPSLRIAHTF
jgi:hypothetical protein